MPDLRPQPSQIVGVPHPPAWVQAMKDLEEQRAANRIARVRERLQQIELKYQNLPPLPPQLPPLLYVMQGDDATSYHDDDASRSFYRSCAEGDLDRVRAFIDHLAPTPADLSYALEEACQNLQLEVVRFLLRQSETQLHYRCFRRPSTSSSQSIFTSGSPELLNLLRILVDFEWHLNQLLGPLQRGKRPPHYPPSQEVALHYPRCILDTDILQFLLDAGADPTIARDIIGDPYFSVIEQPVQRLKGHILEMAVNLSATEAVTLLISRGAKLEYGIPLHSLARRRPHPAAIKVMDEEFLKGLYKETPELEYPTLSTRFVMAQHLIALGEDINRVANVYRLIGPWVTIPIRLHEATALSHSKNSMDWDYVRWLLENGADLAASPKATSVAQMFYSIGASHEEVEETYEDMIRQFQQPGQSVTAAI
ncbi:Putative ankyrin repeat-containing domain superfamily [Colletotrichum destructivum]|uniref:Ankyrin repeat-containing domain superfamily n=1 Tax=Colletotrichum destructivum TaxID=34406 RepID=A0AAX4IJ21_9PEZI|nr:Putative ankyrin repeat-containing domain superfamily [Colletotrichum destructivum]